MEIEDLSGTGVAERMMGVLGACKVLEAVVCANREGTVQPISRRLGKQTD
jgi:hypothetical protein